MEQFSQHTIAFSGFFTVNEIEKSIQSIINQQQSKKQDESVLECNRRLSFIGPKENLPNLRFCTKFWTNQKLLLTQFYVNINRSCSCDKIELAVVGTSLQPQIARKLLFEGTITIQRVADHEMHLILPKSISIKKGRTCSIELAMNPCCERNSTHFPLKNIVQMDNGIKIRFPDDVLYNDCVSRLVFSTKVDRIQTKNK